MRSLELLTVCAFVVGSGYAKMNPYPGVRSYPCVGDPGSPLFLTPYIEAGRIALGQAAARVHLPGTNITSYSGYFTVNKPYNSNLFFWYFPAEVGQESAPVVLWLQGGPGGSSLFALFNENGPFSVDDDLRLHHREVYWSQLLNVIYIDNPAGTGFSFTDSEEGFAKDEVAVGRDLYSALSQFFRLFPELRENDFFVSGESYAGKYIPAVAHTIHTNNKVTNDKINLKGIAIGDGFSDPENMMVYDEYLYQLGVIDSYGKRSMKHKEDEIVANIKKGDYVKAQAGFDGLMSSMGPQFNVYNFVDNDNFDPNGTYDLYLQTDAVRRAIHVGNLTYHDGSSVAEHLKYDFMQSVRPWVQVLLEEYRVLFYNGQLDVIVAYPVTVNFLNKLEWSGAEEYRAAERKEWKVGGDLAGYAKTVRNFTEVLVRDAGHMVPMDQPVWALDLITRFAFNKPF